MKRFYLIVLLVAIPFLGFNQNIGIGGSAIYNVQSETFGVGARVNFYPNSTLSFVPQYSYALFSLGLIPIKEWTAGLALELKVHQLKTFTFYLLGHGGFNYWSNSDASTLNNAENANWNAEAGIGNKTKKALRPFLEYRYNVKFQETHLQLVLLYIFGYSEDNGGYRKKSKMKKKVFCPAYN